jgi:hypothetical protein
MKNKLLFIIILMLIFLLLNPINAKTINKYEKLSDFERFLNCYIEIEMVGEFESIGTHPEFGLGLMMLYDDNTKTTIYTEENGEILWQYQGVHWIKITLFIGHEEIKRDAQTLYGRAFNLRVYAL